MLILLFTSHTVNYSIANLLPLDGDNKLLQANIQLLLCTMQTTTTTTYARTTTTTTTTTTSYVHAFKCPEGGGAAHPSLLVIIIK